MICEQAGNIVSESPPRGADQPIMSAAFRSGILLVIAIGVHSGGRAAGAAADYVFYHENVLGTSLELCIDAASPDAACRPSSVF